MEWCMITAAMSYLILLLIFERTRVNVLGGEQISWGITEIQKADKGFT